MSLEMDYIGRVVILFVGIAVVTGIILSLGARLKSRANPFGEEKDDATIVRGSFSQADIEKFIEMCSRKSLQDPSRSRMCYVLKGMFSFRPPLKGAKLDCANPSGLLIIEYDSAAGVVVTC